MPTSYSYVSTTVEEVKQLAIENLLQKVRAGSDPEPGPDLDISAPDDLSGLTEADDLLEPDPKPDRKRAPRVREGGRSRITAAQRRQVEDALVILMTMPAAGWALRDPHCGNAALQAVKPTAKSLVPIIARNPVWLAWFTSDTGWLNWLGVAVALKPVATAVWSHHVAKTVSAPQAGEDGETDAYAGYGQAFV